MFCYRDSSFDESNPKFPLVTIAHYGPDDQKTTKIVVGVFLHATAEPILRRFVSSKVKADPKVQLAILEFLSSYKIKQTVIVDENIGCPHEEEKATGARHASHLQLRNSSREAERWWQKDVGREIEVRAFSYP